LLNFLTICTHMLSKFSKKTLNHLKACKEKRQLFQEKIQEYRKSCRSIVYILDVNFAEDDSPVNIGYAAKNLAIFKRLALNILGFGKSLLERRKKAAWNEEYLTEIIRKFFIKSF